MADQTFAVHCGFFDAIDSDRVYSADEMNRPYRRVISNGVFATPSGTPSTDLQVVESSGMNIICKAGEGLFADKWFENPSSIVITVPDNTATVPRIDSVLVQVDTRTSGRAGNIVHRTGTPASSPTPPAINGTEGVIEYRLANIRVNAGVTSIQGRYITDRRGSSDCPWVTSLIYQVDTSTLYDQWQAAYAEYFEEEKAIWDAWYAQLTEDLDVSMTLDRHVNTVTTTAQTTGTIPIGLAYNHNTDILEVYINGLRAIEGTHYIVVNDDTSIMFENQLQIGQTVTFVVMRSVISGSATNITVLLQELESQIAGIAGGTPTVVDAKADMTEHDKIYILSTDGKWYYYSATAEDWVIGGTYGGVPTDTTLTQEGMAADAKAVGDALDGKADESELAGFTDRLTAVENSLSGTITLALTWERGNINTSGENSNNLRTIRTPLPLIPIDVDTLTLTFDGSYSTVPIVSVYCYQSDGTYISPINKESSATITLPEGTSFVRFKLSTRESDSTTVIDPSEGNDFLQVTYFSSVDVVQLANNVEGKLDKNAGTQNAGKILSVGGDGMIVPVDSARTQKTIYMEWERGNISSSGNNSSSSSTKYIRNKYRYKVIKSTNLLRVPTGMTIRVFVYNTIAETSDAFVEYFGAYTADAEITLTVGTYIRLVALYTNNDDIAISDGDDVALSYGITEQEAYDSYTGMVLSGYSALSMFETIGIIGDSWASGSIHTPAGYVDTNYQMSWGKILGRKIGATVTNFSKGGLSTKTWLEDTTYGLSALLADAAKQCYIINLGINDNTQIKAGTLTLGTIEDVNTEDYTQNPDTFFGDYGRIIGNIKAHAPKAVIFLLSVARPNERNMDTYIAQIAEEYGLPFINLPDDDYFESGYFFGSIYDGHMSAYGYSGMAQAIERLLQKYVIENRLEFAYYDGLTT